MSTNESKQIERSAGEVQAKIEELRSKNDYRNGPSGRDQRYKDQGYINALRWVLGSDIHG